MQRYVIVTGVEQLMQTVQVAAGKWNFKLFVDFSALSETG